MEPTIVIQPWRVALKTGLSLQNRSIKTLDEEIEVMDTHTYLVIASIQEINTCRIMRALALNHPKTHFVVIEGNINELTWTPVHVVDLTKNGFLILEKLDDVISVALHGLSYTTLH